jgi:hypothetical protein
MSTFQFPQRATPVVVETDLMHEVADLTVAAHNSSPIVVWAGSSRLGKTTTAEWLTSRIEAAYIESNPDAFHAARYQATELADWHSVDKTAMGAFHVGVLGPLDEGLYRRLRAHELATLVVNGLLKRRIELVFVDEAGLYSLRAMRGLIAVRDRMVEQGGRLTLVLVGMDDLPCKLDQNPQVAGRVHEWCYFKPYTLRETARLVRKISPLWAQADFKDADVRRQLEFLHLASDGVQGRIVPFVQKVEQEVAWGHELSVALLKVVQLRTARNRSQAQSAQRNAYRSKPKQKPNKAQ